jgi:hypothetical protein
MNKHPPCGHNIIVQVLEPYDNGHQSSFELSDRRYLLRPASSTGPHVTCLSYQEYPHLRVGRIRAGLARLQETLG